MTLSPGAKGFHHISTGPLHLPPLAAALRRLDLRRRRAAAPRRRSSLCSSAPPSTAPVRRCRQSAAPPCLFAARSLPELGEEARPIPHFPSLSIALSRRRFLPEAAAPPLAAERPTPATAAPPGPPSSVPRRPLSLPGLTPPRTEPRSTIFGVLRRSAAASARCRRTTPPARAAGSA